MSERGDRYNALVMSQIKFVPYQKYFVWVAGTNGPEAQIWDKDVAVSGEGKAKPCLFKVALPTDREELSLNVLMELYKDDKPQASLLP